MGKIEPRLSIELRHRLAQFQDVEQRVIAEAAGPARLSQQLTFQSVERAHRSQRAEVACVAVAQTARSA